MPPRPGGYLAAMWTTLRAELLTCLLPGTPSYRHDASSRMTRAGLPATSALLGTSEVTTLPAATTAPSPIVTPARTVAPVPIHTWSPMVTPCERGRGIPSTVSSWAFVSRMLAFHEIAQPEPILMCSKHVTVEQSLMNDRVPISR